MAEAPSPHDERDANNVARAPLHTRNIVLQGYRRADGLYDIEGRLRDTKSYDRESHGVKVRAGDPIHDMLLCMTVGRDLVIREVRVESIVVPYAGYCDAVGPDYRKLQGLTIASGFMREVRRLVGGAQGCTHLTELIGAVATAAFQTMSVELNASNTERPFQIDGCYALKSDGAIVKAFHPTWYAGQPD
ncbi:DUF2889 domain-containing protein [Paraburkholderia acidisoli]|uniref:DUF2889 domain-containing protein n=1 Tax=Paraburkholderia acidisoli TaxID=2571748 RepID=A0A7Z2GMU4_9BURK|nr:DUF2889 domain-containing protein [Paraburkholderia acidisoli]